MTKKIIYGGIGIVLLSVFIAVVVFPDDEKETPIIQKQTEVPATEVPTSEAEQKEISKEAPQEVQTTPQSESQYYTVVNVVDGDTIKINKDGVTETLRLIGIDTPETVDPRKPVQCFGKEASDRAKELLSGKKVRIETDDSQDTIDKYGRLLVYVYRDDGLFFNKKMIEDGYAYEYTYNIPYKYQVEFKHAENTAHTQEKGLWSPDTCNGKADPVQNLLQGGGVTKFYTSSHPSAKYYYPEVCTAWEGLSERYLKSFDSLEELLGTYQRTLSPQCK